MCLWSPRARLITTANCVGDGRNTLATYRGGGVSECPQHEWLSETALLSFSLSDYRSISLSTWLLLEVGKPWRDLVQHLHLHLHVERGSTLGQPR